MNRNEFLKQVFNNIDGLVNIREIDNNSNVKQLFLTLDELQEYKTPIDTNVFYGVYTRSGKDGTAKGCKTTGALWADYDKLEALEVEGKLLEVKKRISEAGLPAPSIYVNSGHGIHVYWLLDKRESETAEILKAIVVTTGADASAKDKARVMRLPGSMNVKGEPIKCEVIDGNLNRYSIETFREVLNIQAIDEVATTDDKTPIAELLNADRPCIRAMANGVKEGHRNFAEGRLIKYLQVKGKTKEATKAIILKWNRNNKPSEDTRKLLNDFEIYWRTDYKLLGCSIKNIEMQSILSDYCSRGECRLNTTIGSLKLDNTIKYNNRLFNFTDKLTGHNLIVLGLLLRHKEGLTMKKITEKLTARATGKCCISRMTLISSLKYLKSIGLIENIEGNKRAGKENLYKAIPQGTFGLGYTICSNGAINGVVDGRVTATEFKLYVLLLRYAYQKGECYPSQATLGKELRTTSSAVSMLLSGLEEADYIKKNINYLNGAESLIYTLLV